MEAAIPSWRQRRAVDVSRLRINLTYAWRHGRLPNLDQPRSFTEHVQYRKLHDRDLRMSACADKLAVKSMVADRLGAGWVIPTLWSGTELPTQPLWPAPFVVKARHGCNQNAFVFDDDANWPKIRRKTQRWMKSDYGFWLDESIYRHIPRGILVEPFVGQGPVLPLDYKFYVFNGRVEYIQVHLDRAANHRWIVFDRGWRRVSALSSDADPPRPVNLDHMMAAAGKLGRGFDFVRVDLYEIDAVPLFGEMTFYPGSGLDRFDPVSLDWTIGAHWARAKAAPGANKS